MSISLARKFRLPDPVFDSFPNRKLIPKGSIRPFKGYDLANDVHPIMGPDNFDDADYEALLPALRLASRLLLSENSLKYFFTVFHVDPAFKPYAPDAGYGDETYVYHPTLDRKLTKKEVKVVKRDLEIMADTVAFYHEDLHDGSDGTCGFACDEAEISLAALGFEGWHSKIVVSDDAYNEITKLYLEAGGNGSKFPPELLWAYMKLACVLLHELAHAAQRSRWGEFKDEIALVTIL